MICQWSLIDLSDRTFEGLILLITKEYRTTKLLSKNIYFVHSILVCGMERFFFGGLSDMESLVIIVIECVECVGIVHHNIKERIAFVRRLCRLLLMCRLTFCLLV